MEKSISRLGFGGWQLGNDDDWELMSEETAIKLIQTAYQQGINFFDTAPNYASGRSETYIGKAVKDFRDNIYINSKYGHDNTGEIDFSVEGIELSLRKSLARLQTTYLDSVLLHNPSMDILEGKTGHYDELERMKRLGLIKAYGASVDTKDEIVAILKQKNVTVIELLYNVFFQSCRDLLPEIHKRGIKLIIKVPLDSGWLSGKYDETSLFKGIRTRWDQTIITRRADLVDKLAKIAGTRSLTKYAMGFLWTYPEITTVIPGIRNIDQLNDLIDAHKFDFPISLKHQFERFYDQYIAANPLPW